MQNFKNQIIGLLRFSYPAQEGFSVSQLSPAALEDHLYDPDRLETKFSYLETITLPSLAAQTDPDFTLVIKSGQNLPWPFKKRIRRLEERYGFVKSVFLQRMGAAGAAKRGFRRALEEDATHVTGFRIDDDDAVAVDYIEKTRLLSNKIIDAGLAIRPFVIAFSKGVYWNLADPKQSFYEFREAQPLGLACAMITTSDLETSIYRYNHRRLPCHVPTFMDPDDFMFLRTLHWHNDSGRRVPPHAEILNHNKAWKLFEKRFGLDVRAAISLMPEPPQ